MGIETLALASMAGSVGSSIIGGIGQQQQYGAQAASARYQAQVAENNRLVAEQNARYATAAGMTNAQNRDYLTAAAIGRATVAQAAGGLDVTTGSPLAVRESMRQMGRLQTLEEIQKANVDAYGYRTKATEFGAEADLQRMKAESADRAGTTALFGSILGGVSSVGDKWLRFQNVGVNPFKSFS